MQSIDTLLYETMSSLAYSVNSKENFIAWTQGTLQSVFPHGAFIGGMGKIHPRGVKPLVMLSANFPDEYLNSIYSGDGSYQTDTLQRWLQTGEPQLYEPTSNSVENDKTRQAVFMASGLRNIASHGVLDIKHHFASYFSFHQIPLLLGASQKHLLKLIVPGMHAAMLSIIRLAPPTSLLSSPIKSLSQRETQVLAWVCKGKTNYEISLILGNSSKTVKNQVQAILIKLNVNNRAQAAAKAIELNLLELGQYY